MSLPPGLTPPPPPPESPERPFPETHRAPWPWWFAPVGFLAAFFAAGMLFVLLGGIAGTDAADDDPAVTVIGTLLQGVVLVGTAVVFTAIVARPRASQFGLRPTRLWPAIGWTALAYVSFIALAATYVAITGAEGDQTVTEDLGADQGTLAVIAAGLVVIVVAPISEEVFFRGFFYGALRNRLGVVWAVLISAVLFGAIHITSSDTLPLIPVLALLGALLCLLYEKTGSLYPCIALHAVNNAIAYAVPEDAPDGAEYVSLALLPLMLAACLLAPRLAPGRQAAAGAGLP